MMSEWRSGEAQRGSVGSEWVHYNTGLRPHLVGQSARRGFVSDCAGQRRLECDRDPDMQGFRGSIRITSEFYKSNLATNTREARPSESLYLARFQ